MFAGGSAQPQPQHSGGSIGGGRQGQHHGHTNSGLSGVGSLGSFSSHGSASWQRMLDETDGKHGGRGNEGEVTSKHRPAPPQTQSPTEAQAVALSVGSSVPPSTSPGLSGQAQSSGCSASEEVRFSKNGKRLSSTCFQKGRPAWNQGLKGYPRRSREQMPKKIEPKRTSAAISLGDWVAAAAAARTNAGTGAGTSPGAAALPDPKRQRRPGP